MPAKLLIESKTDDPTINLALATLRLKKQALIFANTKRSAEKAAEDLSKRILDSSAELITLSEEVLSVLAHPTKQCERLAKCVKKGVAFHHAGLTHKQRELIEDNFRTGTIKIICLTFNEQFCGHILKNKRISFIRFCHHTLLSADTSLGRLG